MPQLKKGRQPTAHWGPGFALAKADSGSLPLTASLQAARCSNLFSQACLMALTGGACMPARAWARATSRLCDIGCEAHLMQQIHSAPAYSRGRPAGVRAGRTSCSTGSSGTLKHAHMEQAAPDPGVSCPRLSSVDAAPVRTCNVLPTQAAQMYMHVTCKARSQLGACLQWKLGQHSSLPASA